MERVIIFLLFSIFMLVSGDAETQELNAIFDDLEKQLNYKQEFVSLIKDVKDEVTKSPTITTRALGMAKALNLAVPKLTSSSSTEIARGIFDVVAGIAENLPFGQFIAPLASLVSGIIGLVSGAKVDNTMQTFIQQVVREESDNELESQAMASKQELTTAFNYLISKHSQTLDQADVTRLVSQVPITTGVGILALLESRIASRSIKATSYEAAKRSYSFCFLYAQIATIRDMLIDDLIFLLRKAGDDDEARSYNTVKSSFLNNYKTALKFLHAPKIEQTTTVSHYYPPGHDAKSKYLRDFIKLAGIPDMASWTGSKYILLSVRWPKYHIKMLASKYLYFSYGTVPDYNQILFIQRSDGFYQLKRENDWFTIDPNYPDYVKYTDKEPVNDPNGHFVVVRYPPTSTGGKDIVVVMSRKYRGKYVAGQSGSSYVKLLGQDFGREMQFFYKKCNRIFNYGTGSWFCDKLP